MVSSVSGGAARLMLDRNFLKMARASGGQAAIYWSTLAGLTRAAAMLGRSGRRALRNPRKPRFDRPPDLIIELAWILAGGVDRFADHHTNGSGFLDDAAPDPKVGGVMRQGHHEFARLGGEQRAAHAVFARLPRHDARALGKNDDPQTGGQPLFPLLDDLVYRPVSRASIDRDGTQEF